MSQRLLDLREEKNLSQSAVATLLQCTQSGYSKYERGARDIPTAVLITLARFYKTSIDYLLGETDVREPYPKKI